MVKPDNLKLLQILYFTLMLVKFHVNLITIHFFGKGVTNFYLTFIKLLKLMTINLTYVCLFFIYGWPNHWADLSETWQTNSC